MPALHPNDEAAYKSWAVCAHPCGAVKNRSAPSPPSDWSGNLSKL